MSNYTWHKVSDEEKEEIKKDAKNLLDEFSAKLEKISIRDVKEEVGENLREEGEGLKPNEEFREEMLENAPLVEDGLIVAERGGWK
jgi:Asp-tRNA(Asn)/Glu-tRNA(Gln) amidotransferase C subunit